VTALPYGVTEEGIHGPWREFWEGEYRGLRERMFAHIGNYAELIRHNYRYAPSGKRC
jgi:hypothetical protein